MEIFLFSIEPYTHSPPPYCHIKLKNKRVYYIKTMQTSSKNGKRRLKLGGKNMALKYAF